MCQTVKAAEHHWCKSSSKEAILRLSLFLSITGVYKTNSTAILAKRVQRNLGPLIKRHSQESGQSYWIVLKHHLFNGVIVYILWLQMIINIRLWFTLWDI